MRGLLIILICIVNQTTYGQFGIIADNDGFVNVRNSPKISNNIIDTLTNGQIVFCLEAEGEWRPTDYDFSGEKKSGYIHNTRVKFISDFDKISNSNLTDSSITFKQDSIKLTISKTRFNPKDNDLQYHKGENSKNEMNYLEKINEKEIWGTDGNIPKIQYNQFELTLGKEKINLPTENLYEPSLENTRVNVDTKNKIIYISASNSDGAGGYEVLWIIENNKFKERILTVGF